MDEHSPTPPKLEAVPDPKEGGWEFSAIPWTFELDTATTVGDGWMPFAVAYITPKDSTIGECCLVVRRPA